MFVLLLLIINPWPSIDTLPADYGGDSEIRHITQRAFLNDANNDPNLATILWYEFTLNHYAKNMPDVVPAVEEIMQEMINNHSKKRD